MEHKTPAFGKIYTVTSPAGCTVTDAATLKLLQTCAAGVQTPFVACGPSVIISDDSALFAGPFDFARVPLGSSGGAGAPLTPDQLTAVENAVGGMLEDVTIVPQEEAYATGWIGAMNWAMYGVGVELFKINDVTFTSHGATTTDALVEAINELLGDVVVATAESAQKINLVAKNVGSAGNNIRLSTNVGSIVLSGASLTGGQDEVLASMKLIVDNKGARFSHIPEGAILNTGGLPIDTIGGNVYHRTGSATFIGQVGGQDKTTAVMSGKGFTVYHGSASASAPVIFRVSADASVDPFISLATANGNEKIRISGDAVDPKIEINGARALTREDAIDCRVLDYLDADRANPVRYNVVSVDYPSDFLDSHMRLGANTRVLRCVFNNNNPNGYSPFFSNSSASSGCETLHVIIPAAASIVGALVLSGQSITISQNIRCVHWSDEAVLNSSSSNRWRWRAGLTAARSNLTEFVFDMNSASSCGTLLCAYADANVRQSPWAAEMQYLRLEAKALTTVAAEKILCDYQHATVVKYAEIFLPAITSSVQVGDTNFLLSKWSVLCLLDNINPSPNAGAALTIGCSNEVWEDAEVQAKIASMTNWTVNQAA